MNFLQVVGGVCVCGLMTVLHPVAGWWSWSGFWAGGLYWAVVLQIEETTKHR